jgi:hypothetical protein
MENNEVLNPQPHPSWAGFHYPPNELRFVINRNGVIRFCSDGRSPKFYANDQGYLYFTVWNSERQKVQSPRVHRVMALTFVGRPERHLDKSFEELDVNHIDGDKANYQLSNLEWVTKKENTRHAIENELWQFNPTLARNILTGEIKRYVAATYCAQAHDLNILKLNRHLKSSEYGTITKDWWVFKYDDDRLWPVIPEHRMLEDCWSSDFGIWYAKHVETGDVVLANTLREMLEALRIDVMPEVVARVLRTNPKDTPFQDWFIWYDERPAKEVAESLPGRYRPKMQAAFRIRATNLKTGKVTIHESIAKAADVLNVTVDHIRNVFRRGSVREDYLFEKIGVNTDLIDRTGKGPTKDS